jgi:putative SOS response-associated peptidase YedK
MLWGLIPHFAESLTEFEGLATINARAESLIPGDGFYEWKQVDKKAKKPYAFRMKGDAPLAFAGLWDAWKDPAQDQWLQSFTIVTTTPNELIATVHNRMPVILHPDDYEEWLTTVDGEIPPTHLLRPFPTDEMKGKEAHKDVGNVRNNHPGLLNSA